MRLRVSAVALAVLAAACAEVPTGLIEPSLQGGSPLLAIHNSPTAGALDDASNAYDEVATNKYAKRNPGTFDGDRQYMRTVATDYNGKDFTAQLVFSLTNTAGDGATIHFFGMGPGTPAGANNEPTGVFFRIHTPDVGGGAIHVASRNAAGGGFTSVTSIGNITVNGGTHRAIITKSGNQMTFGVDVGNDGTVNFSHVVSNYTTLTDINGSNSSIYFGTSNQDRFTPSITVAGAGELVIDDFTSGGGTFVGGWWGYMLQTSLSDVVGGSREHGWYNHNGVLVDEVAGAIRSGRRSLALLRVLIPGRS
jgi:hypothetical protein